MLYYDAMRLCFLGIFTHIAIYSEPDAHVKHMETLYSLYFFCPYVPLVPNYILPRLVIVHSFYPIKNYGGQITQELWRTKHKIQLEAVKVHSL